jgi:hypothetical protein
MRKKEIQRRIDALERAERKPFASVIAPTVLAYYLGNLEEHEPWGVGLMRALEYDDLYDAASDLVGALRGESSALANRGIRAYRRLFERFGFKYPAPQLEIEDRIVQLAERLPACWQKMMNERISECIREQIEARELDDLWRELETMAQQA